VPSVAIDTVYVRVGTAPGTARLTRNVRLTAVTAGGFEVLVCAMLFVAEVMMNEPFSSTTVPSSTSASPVA
jgi:hypothetical protein